MPKRSQVLLLYDRIHRGSVNAILSFSAVIGALGFLRACDILFNPKPLPTPEEHPDYQKMLEYQRQQEVKEHLSN